MSSSSRWSDSASSWFSSRALGGVSVQESRSATSAKYVRCSPSRAPMYRSMRSTFDSAGGGGSGSEAAAGEVHACASGSLRTATSSAAGLRYRGWISPCSPHRAHSAPSSSSSSTEGSGSGSGSGDSVVTPTSPLRRPNVTPGASAVTPGRGAASSRGDVLSPLLSGSTRSPGTVSAQIVGRRFVAGCCSRMWPRSTRRRSERCTERAETWQSSAIVSTPRNALPPSSRATSASLSSTSRSPDDAAPSCS